MTWTTSADPWANGIRKEAARAPRPGSLKTLLSNSKFLPPTVPALAVGHLCLLAILTPALAEPAIYALLMMSGLALFIAALASLRGNLGSTIAAVDDAGTARLRPRTATPPDGAVSGSLPLAPGHAGATAPKLRDIAFRANAQNADWADLMARVSHELRTPLNAVLGFSDLMDRGTFGPLGHQRYQEYVRHIHESGRDLLKSAEDTLAVTSLLTASSQSAASEVIDFSDVAVEAWAFFGRLPQSKGVTLVLDVPAGTEIICDRRTIRQVLINLISEALTRSSPGNAVTVTTTLAFGQVGVAVTVPPCPNQSQRAPGSLDVCLARTLLEFHGALLIEQLSDQTGWRATSYLEGANQPDFFAA